MPTAAIAGAPVHGTFSFLGVKFGIAHGFAMPTTQAV